MADPHLTPDLDGWDRLTVSVYRGSLVVASVAGLAAAGSLATGGNGAPGHTVATAAAAIAAVTVHLYARVVRGVLAWLAVGGLILVGLEGADGLLSQAGRGLVYAGLGALAFKEWFCFRIPGLRAVPLFLAWGVLVQAFGDPVWASPGFGLGFALVGVMALAKLRMPLGHDIGDRSAYQV